MTIKIEEISTKYFIGKKALMGLASVEIADLWRSFMPRRNEIQNRISKKVYSIQIHKQDFNFFDDKALVERWAAVEVLDFDEVPKGMETLEIAGGLYASFIYRGTPENFYQAGQYFYNTWLPSSNYMLDKRAHFEVLEENYRPNDPNAREVIWIPIKEK